MYWLSYTRTNRNISKPIWTPCPLNNGCALCRYWNLDLFFKILEKKKKSCLYSHTHTHTLFLLWECNFKEIEAEKDLGNLWYNFLLTEGLRLISHQVSQGMTQLVWKKFKYKDCMVYVAISEQTSVGVFWYL